MEHSKEEIYQKQHIDVDTKPPIVGGARRVSGLRRHIPHEDAMNESTWAVGPPKCNSSQLTWYGPESEYSVSTCVAAFGPTSFTGRRTLIHRGASGLSLDPLLVEVAEALA